MNNYIDLKAFKGGVWNVINLTGANIAKGKWTE